MILLSIKNVSVTYVSEEQRLFAVDNVSLDIAANRSMGIIGESGSGKSTLMHAVLRLLNPRAAEVTGSILFDGKDLLRLSEEELREIRWKDIAVVFQKSMNALSPVHRVGTFLGDVYRIHNPAADKHVVKARLETLLEMVSLPVKVLRMYPHELSGGMMQRVSIAMSVMFNPRLLILDEATTALDVVTQTQILKQIQDIEQELGVTRIMVTHDISVVSTTCDDVTILYAGHIMEVGKVSEVLVEPLHPYTRALIESFPDAAPDRNAKLASITGALPDLRIRCPGCIFAARCPLAATVCSEVRPKLTDYGNGRLAACHMIGEQI
jgi:peptide/nickel transport system ATP-binding protein